MGWNTGVQTTTSKTTWSTWRVGYRRFSWAFQWWRFQNRFFWICSKVVQTKKFFDVIVVCRRFRFYFFFTGVIFLNFFTGCDILVGISFFCYYKNEIRNSVLGLWTVIFIFCLFVYILNWAIDGSWYESRHAQTNALILFSQSNLQRQTVIFQRIILKIKIKLDFFAFRNCTLTKNMVC